MAGCFSHSSVALLLRLGALYNTLWLVFAPSVVSLFVRVHSCHHSLTTSSGWSEQSTRKPTTASSEARRWFGDRKSEKGSALLLQGDSPSFCCPSDRQHPSEQSPPTEDVRPHQQDV
ncbi:unnamed protein product [Vitrella brassicaformis CCMP3155]|uniref:Uncharacterized protein n=1 Tax=Vitrella brassicaformis (strain CCMP3155) TaxID=1169540 RepID=A0A0G4FNY7_VITBC|nr:unnamed protein product [Vitrella brassicaformis CCMP3155]|eukprot:CEM15777.1 unnamed protein product [Vitrella brassicaformis CCMP3155]